MAQRVEAVGRFTPRFQRVLSMAEAQLDVTEFIERDGGVERGAGGSEMGESLLVQRGSRCVGARHPMDVADAQERVREAHDVTALLEQGQCLLAMGQGLFVLSETGEVPADRVEDAARRDVLDPGRAVQVQRLS